MKRINLNGWLEYDKSMVLYGSDLQKSLHNKLGEKTHSNYYFNG